MDKPLLLLVEDEENDAFIFRRTFHKSEIAYSFHRVSNGVEAIEYLRKSSNSNAFPQITFLDLKMPLLNGFEVLAWIQKQTFASQTPVIVLSGSDELKDVDRARQLGATDYLVKPITVAALHQAVEKLSPFRNKSSKKDNGAPS